MRVVRHRDGWLFQSDSPPDRSKGESEGSWEELRSQRDEQIKKLKEDVV